MLCQFTFKNFKSYRDETIFDMQALALAEHKDSLFKNGKGSAILPISVIYGPNGGGKSNMLEALAYVVTNVVKPIYLLKKNRIDPIIQQYTQCTPYLLDSNSNDNPSEFELFFRIGENEYKYNLSLLQDVIRYESLCLKRVGSRVIKNLYERHDNNIKIGQLLEISGITPTVKPNNKMSYLSFLAINYTNPYISEVQEWFESCVIRNYGNSQMESIIESSSINDPETKKLFIKLLNGLDIDIKDYKYIKETNEFYVSREIKGNIYSLPLLHESEGTKKLFALLPIFIIALREGRLVIADELDAKLHPRILQYIMQLFTNREFNENNAQLIFTSHDMTTMNAQLLRRDEIWFAATNDDKCSELYSLSDIRQLNGRPISPEGSYSKQYLEGKYGADPYLKNILNWEV